MTEYDYHVTLVIYAYTYHWNTLEAPMQGSSNEYPQSIFKANIRRKKKVSLVDIQFYHIENQRTNGPVDAHLRPEIYTCTNKLVRLEWYNGCI